MLATCTLRNRAANTLRLLGGLVLYFLLVTAQPASAQCTYLSNTDFENTQISGTTYQIFDQSTNIISPWRTTASDGDQEVWRSGFNGVPAYSGNQFIELNANIAATTFQNFTAPGGTQFTLNFAHRGRDGVDVMNVSIGSPSPTSIASGTAVTGTTYLNLGNFSDGNSAWGYYSVTFTLPTGVAGNNFSVRFTSVSAAGGNTSVGNFLDAISISAFAPTIATNRSLTLTCPQTTTNLSGFTASNTPANSTQTWHTGPVATTANQVASVTAVGPGTYYTAFYNTSTACFGATTSVIVIAPTPPATPTFTTTQPTCAVGNGTITITAPTGAGLTYSIDGTNYVSGTTFTGLSPGTYAVRVRNGTSTLCTSSSVAATINAAPLSPVAPTVTVTQQPNCTLATGTITVTAPTGIGVSYSIDGTTYTNTTGVFTGIAPGTYNVTARNAIGCISPSTSVTVAAQPLTPTAPTVNTQQPSCTLATGTITVTSPTGAGLTYSTNGTSYTNTTGVFSGVAPGVYNVTVRNASGCTSTATSVTVTAQPPTPVAPTVSVTQQPNCTLATGTITVTAPTGAGLTYSIDGTTYTNTTGVFSGVAPGVYNVTVRNASACTSTATSVTVTAQPPTPVAPTVSVTQQPNCTLATGTITVTAPTGAGLIYSIDGTTYTNTTGVFSGIAPGVYNVMVRNASGCTSTAMSVTVTAQPVTPTLSINAVTVCAGTSTTLTVTGCTGGALRWNTGDNTTSLVIAPVLTTAYSVTCTATSGCSATTTTTATVRPTPTYSDVPVVTVATCVGTVANNNARVTLTTLQNTERADFVAGSSYGAGPAYGAASNQLVSGGVVNINNLPNPSTRQPYVIRLFGTGGTCVIDVPVLLDPADCRCPGAACPVVSIAP